MPSTKNNPLLLNADVQTQYCLSFANDVGELLRQLRRSPEAVTHQTLISMISRCEHVQLELQEVADVVEQERVQRQHRKRLEGV